jgi:hypothetical protein
MATDSHDILEPTGHRRKRIELKEDDYKEKPLPEVWNALGIDVDKLDKDDVVGLTSGVKIPKVYCKK